MLEGCTVNQLNDIVREMENYLAEFEEISVFTTSIQSYDNATIVVEFKPEYEKTSFPMQLKAQVTSMAINFGGANWSISGIDNNSFNNQIVSSYKSERIILKGYNYQELLQYAKVLIDRLSKTDGSRLQKSGVTDGTVGRHWSSIWHMIMKPLPRLALIPISIIVRWHHVFTTGVSEV